MCVLIFNDLRYLTPHPLSLSPLRGEGDAFGHPYYSFGNWHCYDGVQRTACPTNVGSWPVSRSERNTELSMNLGFFRPAGTGNIFFQFPAMNCRATIAASFQDDSNVN